MIYFRLVVTLLGAPKLTFEAMKHFHNKIYVWLLKRQIDSGAQT